MKCKIATLKKAAGVVASLKNKLKILISQYNDKEAASIFNTEIKQ